MPRLLLRPGPWPLALCLALVAATFAAAFAKLVALDPDHFANTGRVSVDAMFAFGIKDDARLAAGHLAGLVRAPLVHHSLAHAAVNLAGLALFSALLWRLIPRADRTLARASSLLALAILAAAAGFFASAAVHNGPSAGASGAVFGLLGALPAQLAVRRDLPARPRLALSAAAFILGLLAVLAISSDPAVDHAAHLGGLLAGLPLGFAQPTRTGRIALIVAALALVAIGFTTP